MAQYELHDFGKRINLNTDLKNISEEICKNYNLGTYISNEVIATGYEDYNYVLDTTKGKYCVKIFNKNRTQKDLNDYLDRIRIVAKTETNAPKPLFIDGDILLSLNYEQNHYDICVFEFINGKSFFEMNKTPSKEAIIEIAKQAAFINTLDIQPDFVYDSWAVINFEKEYSKKREYLSDEFKKEFDRLLKEFKEIDFYKLPKAFVHGDMITTNVMLDNDSKVWILDFSVSNYVPRIIELAVISCNICLDKESKEKTYENIELLLREYNKYNKLSNYELEVFGVFNKLAHAMHILQTQYIIQTDCNSEENQYWLNEGTTGFLFYDNERFSKLLK